jgi:hypothetical protein
MEILEEKDVEKEEKNIMSEHQPQLILIQFLFVSCMQFNSIQLILHSAYNLLLVVNWMLINTRKVKKLKIQQQIDYKLHWK